MPLRNSSSFPICPLPTLKVFLHFLLNFSNLLDLVNLRRSEKKVRVGGQIIYEPDEADDLDDSDPDDDLNL